jgi:hypothetical protein
MQTRKEEPVGPISENARMSTTNELHLHAVDSFNNLVLDCKFEFFVALDTSR